VKQLEELIKRIDIDLHNHLVSHDVLYLQFAFRWMNNLLMREIPIKAVIRLWDTYLSEKNGFSHFHLYVTAAFLMRFKDEILRRTDFHTVLMFLQNLPTAKWGDTEIDLIVAEAFQLSYLFADAPSHLNTFVKTNDASTNK
ncbi:TBC1 domain family_ member 22B, partial [Caligus rogercresseyi]